MIAATMSAAAPIQVVYFGVQPPDWTTSGYGPFVVHPAATLDELSATLGSADCDAVLLHVHNARELAALADWAAMPRLPLDAAVLLIAPEPAPADALRWVRQGVQDVIPEREAGDATLARATRLAVERQRLERAARAAYATDLGTGLPNRAQLMEHLTHLLALREREPAAMALLALRIDGLALVEARLGTEAANVVRRKVAVRLRSGLRASDVVASIGVDNFAVLLAWIDDPADGDQVARKLEASIRRPVSVSGQDVGLAVRVGVARCPADAKDALGLIQCALTRSGEAVAAGRAGAAINPAARGGEAANDE